MVGSIILLRAFFSLECFSQKTSMILCQKYSATFHILQWQINKSIDLFSLRLQTHVISFQYHLLETVFYNSFAQPLPHVGAQPKSPFKQLCIPLTNPRRCSFVLKFIGGFCSDKLGIITIKLYYVMLSVIASCSVVSHPHQ